MSDVNAIALPICQQFPSSGMDVFGFPEQDCAV
jgi:hypothetical protein